MLLTVVLAAAVALAGASATVAAPAARGGAAAQAGLAPGAYQVALGTLCVQGLRSLDAAPAAARKGVAEAARAAARLDLVRAGLGPLLGKTRLLAAPPSLARPHAKLVAALAALDRSAAALSAKLRKAASPGVAVRGYARDVQRAQAGALAAFVAAGAPPCIQLLRVVGEAVTVDAKPPLARAAKASGRAARLVTLAFRLGDDSGTAAATLTVHLGSARAGRPYAVPFTATGRSAVVRVRWRAPRYIHGFYRYCVVPRDRAGNVGARSCAAITLR